MTDTATRTGAATPLPMQAVVIDDRFWAPHRERVRTRTIPQQEQQLRDGGQFEALKLQWRPPVNREEEAVHRVNADGHVANDEPHIFWESDMAKWIEAASYSLAKHSDARLEAAVDEAIALLAGAQQPDGYLNVYFTVVKPGERFTDLRDAHELYCAGHLIEAGVAHFASTGKTTLLELVRRYADLIDETFGPGGAAEGGYDGHQEIELALVKLARATGEGKYRELALRMIDARGTRPFYFEQEEQKRGTPGYFSFVFPERRSDSQKFREYNQSHEPVRAQREAVGHSVRAMYMYAAMTDLAIDLGDIELREAAERLWASTTGRKMYVTGGIGSDPHIEGFGEDFDLSIDTAYAETCAAVGLVFWAQRMALMTGDGRYVDVLERALYNGVLSGASEDGTHYFYGNPMHSTGFTARNEWFGVACCPPNFARLVESLEYYVYAQRDRTAIVNLYVSGSAHFAIAEGLDLQVRSNAPWNGDTTITVHVAADTAAELALRVPAWSRVAALTVNGEPAPQTVRNGYFLLDRTWSDGDVVEVYFGLHPERVWARPKVEATGGRVALQRGPFVYCVEGIDHDVETARLSLPRDARLRDRWDADRQLMLIEADGYAETDTADELYTAAPEPRTPTRITAVPYFSWANRGNSTMEIWIREAITDR